MFHKDGSPYHELSYKQVYSVEEYEEASAKGGFFDKFQVEHEVIWDCRTQEAETEEDTDKETPKRGRPFTKKEDK